MRYMVIEDDEQIAQGLGRALESGGDLVEIYGRSDEAEQALRTASYDLVILDLGLPDQDGTVLLRSLRATHNHTPVVVVTARDHLSDRVETLDLGADDYLVKPF